MISECSKLASKEYKTKRDRVGRVIHWELCQKLKFDYTNKLSIHNIESALKNKTHKLLWDFDIQTDHLISVRRKDQTPTRQKKKKKNNYWIVNFAIAVDHRLKRKEREKRGKYAGLAREVKKTMEDENDSNTNCNWCARYSHQRIGTGTGGLRRLTVTQTPVENHQLMLVWKTLNWIK